MISLSLNSTETSQVSIYSVSNLRACLFLVSSMDFITSVCVGSPLDPTGALPKYHIPARFVTLIPREFPASQTTSKKRKSFTSAQAPLLPNATSSKSKRSSVSSTKSSNDDSNIIDNTDPLLEDDPLGNMIGQMGFDDLMATNSLEDLGEFDFDFTEEAK